ncbi:hypothetical protein [Agilicoccus flavus]|uniref:hypothetical protein n=1 Tax=Agilicoccus flavus TaxID=2775968 RepID=UPI001CF6487A|nr:hypothetical protein [Agilicoccus flavus]
MPTGANTTTSTSPRPPRRWSPRRGDSGDRWRLLGDDDWELTLVYNYPEPRERSLTWLGQHTIHELVHHGRDIVRVGRR